MRLLARNWRKVAEARSYSIWRWKGWAQDSQWLLILSLFLDAHWNLQGKGFIIQSLLIGILAYSSRPHLSLYCRSGSPRTQTEVVRRQIIVECTLGQHLRRIQDGAEGEMRDAGCYSGDQGLSWPHIELRTRGAPADVPTRGIRHWGRAWPLVNKFPEVIWVLSGASTQQLADLCFSPERIWTTQPHCRPKLCFEPTFLSCRNLWFPHCSPKRLAFRIQHNLYLCYVSTPTFYYFPFYSCQTCCCPFPRNNLPFPCIVDHLACTPFLIHFSPFFKAHLMNN